METAAAPQHHLLPALDLPALWVELNIAVQVQPMHMPLTSMLQRLALKQRLGVSSSRSSRIALIFCIPRHRFMVVRM
jgi:hypothetical protein